MVWNSPHACSNIIQDTYGTVHKKQGINPVHSVKSTQRTQYTRQDVGDTVGTGTGSYSCRVKCSDPSCLCRYMYLFKICPPAGLFRTCAIRQTVESNGTIQLQSPIQYTNEGTTRLASAPPNPLPSGGSHLHSFHQPQTHRQEYAANANKVFPGKGRPASAPFCAPLLVMSCREV